MIAAVAAHKVLAAMRAIRTKTVIGSLRRAGHRKY
jgi:hypothetical protein